MSLCLHPRGPASFSGVTEPVGEGRVPCLLRLSLKGRPGTRVSFQGKAGSTGLPSWGRVSESRLWRPDPSSEASLGTRMPL